MSTEPQTSDEVHRGSTEARSHSWRRSTVVFCVIAVLGALMYAWRFRSPERVAVASDARQNMTIAYNLAHHGCFSKTVDPGPGGQLEPTAYRSPGYPFFLAFLIRVHPDLRAQPLNALVGWADKSLNVLVYWQVLMYLLTAALAGIIVYQLTQNRWAALVTYAGVLFITHLRKAPFLSHSENLITLLFTAASLLLLLSVKRGRWWYFAAAGLCLGLLTLSRAIFLYFLPVLLIWFAFLIWQQKKRRKQLALGAALLALAFLIPVGSWMWRNHRLFNRWFIAGRGGVVLNQRAHYDTMTWTEYKASFLYWSSAEYLREDLLKRCFDPEDYTRLDRHNPDGYYLTARRRRRELNHELGDEIKADKILIGEAKQRILKMPFRHLAVSIPIAIRGICIEKQYWLSWTVFILFAVTLAIAARRRDAVLFTTFFPAFYAYGFHSGVSHNIPRYNKAMAPVFWASAIFAGLQISRWLYKAWKARHAGPEGDADPADTASDSPPGEEHG